MKRHAGFTIVELMVGLLIAMLIMAMVLMFFKQISQVSISSSQDAEYDAQLQTGTLVAQKFIQNAGYGSGNTDDIALGTYATHPAVFWRFIPDLAAVPITYECQGIGEEITADGSFFIHRLVLLTKAACGDSTAIESGTWAEYQPIMSIRTSRSTPIFDYQISSSGCTPFGIDTQNVGLKQLSITAHRQHISAGIGSNTKTTICLNNIK